MEEGDAPVQTENASLNENHTSRTKRSIIENDTSDNDEEYASSGFYVREKAEKSESKSSDESSNDSKKNGNKNEDDSSQDSQETNNEKETDLVQSENKSDKESNNDDDEVSKGEGKVSKDDVEKEETDPLAKENVETGDQEPEKSIVEGEDLVENEKSNNPEDDVKEDDKVVDKDGSESDKKEEPNEANVGIKDTAEDNESTDSADTNNDKVNVSGQDGTKSTSKDKNSEEDKIFIVISKDQTTSKESAIIENDSAPDKESTKGSEKKSTSTTILETHLTKEDEPRPGTSRECEEDEEAEEMEVEVDFDPSLLCPDISMDIDEAPVVTGTNNDGSTDDLLIARTTDVDEITGVEVQFNLTPEEMELRSKTYDKDNPVEYSKIHCTACNVHLGSALDGQANRFVHPLLKVLICKKCYHFYTSGDFEKDEDGSELYCRWCGQGGEVLCCSSCEFVFCKRCIKNNFGIKKFKEIRNSDDWNCFRCNLSQLRMLRVACAEFWDYYRTQLAKASTMAQNDPTFTTTDFTKCCNQEEKTKVQARSTAASRKRKRRDSEDPDFIPGMDDETKKKSFLPPNAVPTSTPGILVIRPTVSSSSAQPKQIAPTSSGLGGGQIFRVGNTTFRPRTPVAGPGYTITRPKVSSSSTSPGYIKIMPQRMSSPRTQNAYTIVPPGGNTRPTFSTIRPTSSIRPGPKPMSVTTPNTVPPMKHEWFEKTVRAAARVNSNLSYTLTQLNRQQSQASSVESLAVVHNKLQEVLSTSINSLIQIRKNLRTEFIAGIKNIKFPPKSTLSTPPPMVPISSKQQDDDDVIIVSPTVSPTGGNSTPASSPSGLVLGKGVSLTSIKKTPLPSTPKPSPKTTPSSSKPGGYLKVKSFSALQSVPSECITIPDDPPMVLDEKTGLVADPLEFCQVDMNDDESSNHSQQSQNSGKGKDGQKSDEEVSQNTKSSEKIENKDNVEEKSLPKDKEIKKEKSEETNLDIKEKSDKKDSNIKEEKSDKKKSDHTDKRDSDVKEEKSDKKKSDDKAQKSDKKDLGAKEQKSDNNDSEVTEQKSDKEDLDSKESDKNDSEVKEQKSDIKDLEAKDDISDKMDTEEKEEKTNTKDSEGKEENSNTNDSEEKSDKMYVNAEKESSKQDSDITKNNSNAKDEKNDDTKSVDDTEEITKNGDASSDSDEQKDGENGDPLNKFTYNTSEEPTAEVKKWLGAKVLIKKSRVVDEIVRAKSKVLNGDCDKPGS